MTFLDINYHGDSCTLSQINFKIIYLKMSFQILQTNLSLESQLMSVCAILKSLKNNSQVILHYNGASQRLAFCR